MALRFLPPEFSGGSLRTTLSLLPLSFLICRRSNSISKSPGPSSPKEPLLFSRDISRSESLRCSSSYSQQIFRPCDLIHGEVLGKGFFGQAIKVNTGSSCSAPLPPIPLLLVFGEFLSHGLALHPAGHQASFLAAGDMRAAPLPSQAAHGQRCCCRELSEPGDLGWGELCHGPPTSSQWVF